MTVSPPTLLVSLFAVLGLFGLGMGAGILLAAHVSPPLASQTGHSFFAPASTHLTLNNPARALRDALASPLLYHDALNNPGTIDTQEEHWTAVDNSCFFASDGYHVQGHPRAFCHETGAVYQSMTITVDMDTTEGYSGGLLLRDQRMQDQNGAYFFEVSTDGRYHITNTAMYGTIHDWTSSSALHQGRSKTNTLQIIASGNTFLFYLNAVYMTTVRDNLYENGGVSFACFAQNGTCESTFHNLNIYRTA